MLLDIFRKNVEGGTAFMIAAQNGHIKVLKVLLNYVKENKIQFDIDHRTSTGESAMMLAAFKGHADVVELLLQNGANPFLENIFRVRVLVAAEKDNEKGSRDRVIKLLKKAEELYKKKEPQGSNEMEEVE